MTKVIENNFKVIEDRYPNGQLHVRATYENGKLNGLFQMWHDNGQLYISCNMSNGKYNGIFCGYDESGKCCKLVHYKNGQVVV